MLAWESDRTPDDICTSFTDRAWGSGFEYGSDLSGHAGAAKWNRRAAMTAKSGGAFFHRT